MTQKRPRIGERFAGSSGSRFAFVLLVYISLDFSDPNLSGALNFDLDQSVDAVHTQLRGRIAGQTGRHMKLALVIERDAESVKLVKAILERWDFAIRSAASTTEAVDMIRAVRPHIILCDITTPITDAFAFIRDLRGSPDTTGNKVPVIATTTSYEDIDARTARAAGFDVFLRKPLDPDQLPQIVSRLIAGPTPLGPGER
jgi:CheY-like chemotaxis protein